tara:strand:+ start:507 stop:926 length:420 start_codon:yes stop_codon:yes gene_type:complete
MGSGNTKNKVKAKCMSVQNIKGEKTSFVDCGAKEVLYNIDSTHIESVGMVRNRIDYTLVDVIVLYKGGFNLGKADNPNIVRKYNHEYRYLNVDIDDYKYIKEQALRGNSVGKAINKVLKDFYNYIDDEGTEHEIYKGVF